MCQNVASVTSWTPALPDDILLPKGNAALGRRESRGESSAVRAVLGLALK